MHFGPSISPSSSETMPRYFFVSKLGEWDTDNVSLVSCLPAWRNPGAELQVQ